MPQPSSWISKLLLCILLPAVVWAETETAGGISWQHLETKYTVLRYQTEEDLRTFNDSVEYGTSQWAIAEMLSDSDSDSDSDPESLNVGMMGKVDALYERVQRILDMRKRTAKVTINLYSNRKQLDAVYRSIYAEKSHIRAWYIFEYNTIYLNVQDLHEGMLAHEMAHSIIDHYLLVRPPAATAEILARYVDKHVHK